MKPNTFIRNNPIVEDFQMRENLLSKIRNRFYTYGYQQVRTSTFEEYDMYDTINGTVNKDDMIKVVDTSGKVLVLRPDVTIPVFKMTTWNKQQSRNRLRFFYVLDIFRQSIDENGKKENTQAGIECFGESTPETDAEVLVQAIHTLKDLDFSNFKIEIGHAGFFKELIAESSLNASTLEHIKSLIQTKNMTALEAFLAELPLCDKLRSAIQKIPLLYGNPGDVIEHAKEIVLNENMQMKLDNLKKVVDLLKDYGVEDAIVCNLGLINNMNYYTDIIFQGFIENVGKPVLMGGRYDDLGEGNDNSIPAIGFAFDVDFLIQILDQRGLLSSQEGAVEMTIYYEGGKQKEALLTAFNLRNEGFQVLTFSSDTSGPDQIASRYTIYYGLNKNELICNKHRQRFSNFNELIYLIQKEKAG